MSSRNWLSDFAVVGGLIVAVVLLIGGAEFAQRSAIRGVNNPTQTNDAGQKQNGADQQPNLSTLTEHQRKEAAKDADCRHANESAYGDCLIQARTMRATEKQADFAERATNIAFWALLFAGAAAAAAFWTVHVMRKSAERQLRAYISVDSTSLIDASSLDPIPHDSLPGDPHSAPKDMVDGAPPKRPRGNPGVSWGIKNFGQTPAYDVAHWGMMDVLPISQEGNLTAPPPDGTGVAIYLGPTAGSTKWQWLPRILTEAEMQEIRDGRSAVYIWGRVDYRDAFNKRRVTVYRLRYSNSAYPPFGNPTMSFCVGGNQAT